MAKQATAVQAEVEVREEIKVMTSKEIQTRKMEIVEEFSMVGMTKTVGKWEQLVYVTNKDGSWSYINLVKPATTKVVNHIKKQNGMADDEQLWFSQKAIDVCLSWDTEEGREMAQYRQELKNVIDGYLAKQEKQWEAMYGELIPLQVEYSELVAQQKITKGSRTKALKNINLDLTTIDKKKALKLNLMDI